MTPARRADLWIGSALSIMIFTFLMMWETVGIKATVTGILIAILIVLFLLIAVIVTGLVHECLVDWFTDRDTERDVRNWPDPDYDDLPDRFPPWRSPE